MSITGPTEVKVGSTITLTGSAGWSHRWSVASGSDKVNLSNISDRSVNVTGVSAGSVTIKHQYRGMFENWRSETYTVTVTEALPEGTYQLYVYTVVPGKESEMDTGEPNDVWNGMGIGTISGELPPSTYGDQLTDDVKRVVVHSGNNTINNFIETGKISVNQPSSPYPSITVDGETYTYATTPEQENQKGYYTIQWIRVAVSGGANTGNNDYNKPGIDSKIPTYHLDGIVILNQENKYTVNFALKDVGSSEFVIQENYSRVVENGFLAGTLTRPEQNDVINYPLEKYENGINYKFDGWYKDQNCTIRVDWETETINQNTTYYARYIPETQSITVSKKVTGGLGDLQKKFKFEYSYTTTSGTVSETVKAPIGNGDEFVIENIPVGATLTLTETGAAGYTTSASYNDEKPSYAPEGENSDLKTMTINITDVISTIEVVNNKEVKPDTGIHLTNWPYVMTLAFAGLGAVTFGLYKYRRRDS